MQIDRCYTILLRWLKQGMYMCRDLVHVASHSKPNNSSVCTDICLLLSLLLTCTGRLYHCSPRSWDQSTQVGQGKRGAAMCQSRSYNWSTFMHGDEDWTLAMASSLSSRLSKASADMPCCSTDSIGAMNNLAYCLKAQEVRCPGHEVHGKLGAL